jgi:hypothetical protein
MVSIDISIEIVEDFPLHFILKTELRPRWYLLVHSSEDGKGWKIAAAGW